MKKAVLTTHANTIITQLENKNQTKIFFCNKGASIIRIFFSDRSGKFDNIVVTPEPLKKWNNCRTFSGSIVGPLAGRYDPHDGNSELELNRPPIHFHGGTDGLDTVVWNQEIFEKENMVIIVYRYFHKISSTDFKITYKFTDNDELVMEIEAATENEAFINPTNHVYFNLNGTPFKPVTNHFLKLDSKTMYMEDSNHLIIHDQQISPKSYLDFTTKKPLSFLEDIGGINTTFALGKSKIGSIHNPSNGRKITIKTTLPAVVIYTFNFPQEVFSSNGEIYPKYAGITFETQYPPNDLKNVRFSKNQGYYSRTEYQFSID